MENMEMISEIGVKIYYCVGTIYYLFTTAILLIHHYYITHSPLHYSLTTTTISLTHRYCIIRSPLPLYHSPATTLRRNAPGAFLWENGLGLASVCLWQRKLLVGSSRLGSASHRTT